MNKKPDAFTRLINALKVLPNVGPKSAQRMAHQLLQHKREEAQELVDALQNALRLVRKQLNLLALLATSEMQYRNMLSALATVLYVIFADTVLA